MKCLVSGDDHFILVLFPIELVEGVPTVGDEASEVPSDDAMPCVAVFTIKLFCPPGQLILTVAIARGGRGDGGPTSFLMNWAISFSTLLSLTAFLAAWMSATG